MDRTPELEEDEADELEEKFEACVRSSTGRLEAACSVAER